LITLWCLFDDVVNYTEDHPGQVAALPALRPNSRQSGVLYEDAKRQIDEAISGL